MDIERTCEFNRITPEENITYKFAETIIDKKPVTNSKKDHLISKRYSKPSNKTITTVNTETRNRQARNTGNLQPTARQVKNKSHTHTQHGNGK